MFLAEYDYETDIAVQREEAREEGLLEAALKVIQKYHENPEKVANALGVPLERIQEALNRC